MLGNRNVVFGSPNYKGPLVFTPEQDSVRVPRIAGMSESCLAEHLKVDGYQVIERPVQSDTSGDLVLKGPDGTRVLIELKIRDDSPTDRERMRLAAEMSSRNADGMPVEVWRFSSNPLVLEILSLQQGSVHCETLVPLNVWETTADGIFDRARVLDRVADWESRLKALFAEVSKWIAQKPTLRADQTRTVTMSEELMRNYGVPELDLPILDVLESDEAVASFVPRALWIIGADGRVDLITRSGTEILVYDRDAQPPGWQVADRNRRTQLTAFDVATFFALLEAR